MAFKIKKSILAGTSGHRKAVSSIKLNRSMDQSSTPDGRAKSSAFQKKGAPLVDDDKWVKGESTTDTNVTDITDDVKQIDTKTVTPETRVTDYVNDPNVCAKGSALWKEAQAKGMSCPDWMREKTRLRDERDSEAKMRECTCKGKKFKATDCADKAQWPEACKEKKKCGCQTYKANGSKGPWVEHPCGEPNVNCRETSTSVPCFCRDANGERIEYPKIIDANGKAGCEPKPPQCKKQKTPEEKCQEHPRYAERKRDCAEGTKDRRPGTWDEKKCFCFSKTRTTTKIKEGGEKVLNVLKKCIPVFNKVTQEWDNKCVKGKSGSIDNF